MSFGQALSVSPIEIARAVGGIANGGVMMTPHFYKSSKGDEKDWGEGERAISEDAASQVTSCMQTVVSEERALAARLTAYDVAGKTGTAERADENGGYLKENYMSSFMGFAPAQSPKVLCYITLDGTPSGSRCRCGAVPVHYGQCARRVGYPAHEVGGYNLWGVVCCPIWGCSHALHHACAALGYNTPIALLGLQGAAMIEMRRQQPRGRNRGPNRDGRKPIGYAAGALSTRARSRKGRFSSPFPVKTSTAMIFASRAVQSGAGAVVMTA